MALPPGPPESALRQSLSMGATPFEFLDRCRQEYGEYFTVRLVGQLPHVYVGDAEAIRWIFSRPREEFRHLNDLVGLVVGDRSVLLMDGERHRRERQMLMPSFHGERMRAFGEIMCSAARAEVATWRRDVPFAVHPRLQAITLRVITQCVFGQGEGDRIDRLQRRLAEFLNASLTPTLFLAGLAVTPARIRRYLERHGEVEGDGLLGRVKSTVLPLQRIANLRAEIDAMLFEEIARCRAAPEGTRGDILAMLVAARDEQGAPLSAEELRDELLTILVAGHETTATTLAWALHHVLRTPRVEQRLRAEVEGAFPDGVVRPEAVANLAYLKAVVNETLRVSPIAVAVPRLLTRPTKLGPYELPAGTAVFASVYVAHRSANNWERPDAFEPERFLGGDPSPFKFFPFGGGTRRCVGAEFARYQLRLVLAQLFAAVALHPVPGFQVRGRMRGATVGPSDDMPVIVRDRAMQTPVAA